MALNEVKEDHAHKRKGDGKKKDEDSAQNSCLEMVDRSKHPTIFALVVFVLDTNYPDLPFFIYLFSL